MEIGGDRMRVFDRASIPWALNYGGPTARGDWIDFPSNGGRPSGKTGPQAEKRTHGAPLQSPNAFGALIRAIGHTSCRSVEVGDRLWRVRACAELTNPRDVLSEAAD